MRRFHLIAAAAVALLGACDDSTGPDDSTQLGETLSLSEFETDIASTARVEIKFTTLEGLVAREIEVEPDDDEEKIVSRVIAIDPTSGSLTLELGTMGVRYDGSTRFRTPLNSNVSRTTWEAEVIQEVDAGRFPSIEARRNPPSSPQAPSLTVFLADDVRITDDINETKIEVYVDRDNFTAVTNPPPEAFLTVFGLSVEILSNTRLRRIGNPSPGVNVEFDGRVTSVNVSGRTMTLADGTIIQVGATTVFDPDGDLQTLAATSIAVLSGNIVRVEGDGTVQSAGPPRTIAATNVKVEIDD
jgi:hypothetical protein